MAQLAGGTGTPARWVEELPHDVEAIGDQGGLRGSLSDGSLVVARAVAARSSEGRRRRVAHLKRLSQLRDPHLLPVRGAVVEGDTVWVLSECDRGSPLSELLRRGPPPSALAAAIGIDVLAGLAALQRAGLVHGALHAGNVHVGRDGRTRLGDYALRPRFRPGDERLGWGDPRNDVVAVGVLLCTVLAVPVTSEPGDLREAERTAPALVATARALAAGRGGRNARAALAGVRAAAGHLADPGLRRRELGAPAVAAARSAAAPPRPGRGPVPRAGGPPPTPPPP